VVADSRLPPIEVVISEAEAKERLDRVLAARELGVSRSTLKRWFEDGRVEVDGVTAAPKTKARAGAHVVVRPAPPPKSDAAPEDIPLDIVYEDAHLVVLNKPAGLVVHPAPGHRGGTLVNAVLHHIEIEDELDATRPGIVHRLDKDTSGVMVVAKTSAAREGLVARFSTHAIEREYLAIAQGNPPPAATYDTLFGRHPRDRKRMTTKVTRGKRAVTHVRVVERLHGAALVRCRLETGRTHQIRVHLAEHGYPVLGDPIYGRKSADPIVRAAALTLGRQALHAAVLGFVHPVTFEHLRFETSPPEDFLRALDALRTA
jgi:23S rRNA pseudouridine1911/1915/1917 synthase